MTDLSLHVREEHIVTLTKSKIMLPAFSQWVFPLFAFKCGSMFTSPVGQAKRGMVEPHRVKMSRVRVVMEIHTVLWEDQGHALQP